MPSTFVQNFCFCCGPMDSSNIRGVVPSIFLVFSLLFSLIDIVDLAGVPISGVVIFKYYTIFELIFSVIIILYTSFLIWYFL